MRYEKYMAIFALLLLPLPCRVFAQQEGEKKGESKEKNKEPSEAEGRVHGSVEFGVRLATGEVYGRPDLRTGQCLGCGTPFDPSLSTSKFNEYGDVRDGFYVPRFDVQYENILGSNYYASLQAQK